MKAYLFLAQSGLTLTDIALRGYEGVSPLILSGATLTPTGLGSSYYVLDGLPDTENLTITFESPSGVFHARRFKLAETQPQNVIIPIREIYSDPVSSLTIKLFVDGEDRSNILVVTRLAFDGEYSVSGWAYSSFDEQWALVWTYNGIVYALQWTGTTQTEGTVYEEIRAIQSPFPYQISTDNRQFFSTNFIATLIAPTSKFGDEIEKIIRGGGFIDSNETIYIGVKGSIPDGAGPFNVINPTGGFEPVETHDSKRENRTVQILTCAEDYEAAESRAELIYHYLDGLRNVVVTLP